MRAHFKAVLIAVLLGLLCAGTSIAMAADPPIADGLVDGPGGPIVVVFSSDNPYSQYTSEIMRAEGLNSFAAANVSSLTAAKLNSYDVVVLGDITLTTAQVTLLTNWVNSGGSLVAFHPDKKLAPLLGLTTKPTTTDEGYLKIDTGSQPGNGITAETMQFHGSADNYGLMAGAGTQVVANLYRDATTATAFPAVTLRPVGSNGGYASAFTYDLAKSVTLTHQGNPAWAGQDRDVNVQGSLPVIRSDDLFYGAKPGDIQPDYVNLDKVAIPQADEQQRLLANTISYTNREDTPLPKFWYFPNNKKAVIIMAGDDHNVPGGTVGTFTNLRDKSSTGCSVQNWGCYRATSWMWPNNTAPDLVPAAVADDYNAQGFDLGTHVSPDCSTWTPVKLTDTFNEQLSSFGNDYPNLLAQTGSRTHCVAWGDYSSTPRIERSKGIRIDMNYYYWPGDWVANRPGFMTGSGLTMRYVNNSGAMLDVYQAPSHLVNEAATGASIDMYPDAITDLIDRAKDPETGYYAVLGTHYDYSDTFDETLTDIAIDEGIPLVSANQMLEWNDARNASSFSAMTWTGNNLNFTATVNAKAYNMMRGMLPISSTKGSLTGITKAGVTVNYTIETIKGVQYAIFPVKSGAYAASYAADNAAPTVTARTPTPGATGVAPTSSVSAAFSEAIDPNTVADTTFTLKKTIGGTAVSATTAYNPVTKTASLRPDADLAPNTQYTVTVTGGASGIKDLAGNPLINSLSWKFTTGETKLSIWYPDAQSVSNISDPASLQLGIRFRSSIAGKITGIAYYKSLNDAASHNFSLWGPTGVKRASATSSGETASGWQLVTFDTPVSVNANTTYTASYWAAAGKYSYTSAGLSSAITNKNLTALANGGVFSDTQDAIPTSTFNGNNYWVDVIFTP